MTRKRRWTNSQLVDAVKNSKSFRNSIKLLGLKPTGGNYDQVKKYIVELELNTKHFTGKTWNKGLKGIGKPILALEDILIKESSYQSYKLKQRLYQAGLKKQKCEECGWRKKANDGRIPLELDHINGDRHDNRLLNLRVLCPNCHSLKPTHRGKNRRRSGGMVYT